MDFEFSSDQEALRDTVRRFLSAEAPIRPYVRDMLDDERGTTDEVWAGLSRLGATGLLVPEELGGAGLGMLDMGVVLEEMGRLVHPGPFMSSAVAAVSTILVAAPTELRTELLPTFADGTTIGTVAMGEPGVRPSSRKSATAARPHGDRWRLTGVKQAVFDAAGADLIFVSASRGDEQGLFLVPRDSPGVSVVPIDTVDATRRLADVHLEDASARHLGGDAAAIEELLDRLLVALVVDGVGAASAALDMAVGYARERVQFDRPIGSFQAIQHLCADMLQELELARAGAHYALWALDCANPAERHRAATMAKAYASEALPRVGASAIQVFGGIGYTWEHDVHLFYKRLLTLQQLFGGADDHLAALADSIL